MLTDLAPRPVHHVLQFRFECCRSQKIRSSKSEQNILFGGGANTNTNVIV